ncbi:MAG: hypothetical protein ABS75_21905 [Pelagibacterium sp. SCN 63-23]|nr:MAG: hypothetical protein ABS75_21905 [Pelagibacterium sp. SCN 63-23]
MEEILTSAFKSPAPLNWSDLFLRLCMAAVLGMAVMGVYRVSRRGIPRNHSFEVTLVLLAILIAMVTKVIGDSVARAFSLVGALSIVRFRTVVRDTQDTAYVIFAVVVGMAAGANLLPIAIAGLVIVLAVALLLRWRRPIPSWSNETECSLQLKVALGTLIDEITVNYFPRHLESFQLISLSTASKGMALEAGYNVRLRSKVSPTDLVRELNKIEGVQSVELVSPEALGNK